MRHCQPRLLFTRFHRRGSVSAGRDQRSAGGFTIVELIVVLGIISVLMAMLLPALRAARISTHMTVEKNAARQLMVAWTTYADNNQGRVLPGVAPQHFMAYDEYDNPISGGILNIARQRYPWRIAPYLGYEFRGLYINHDAELVDAMENLERNDYIYRISISPSLGLNSQWVGGDYRTMQGFACMDHHCSDEDHPCFQICSLYGRFYVTRLSQVRHTDRLLVFASARGVSPIEEVNTVVEGYFDIRSPYFSELEPKRWSDSFDPGEAPHKFGHVSPRYFGEAVTAFVDGHVDTLNTNQLQDMRHWANDATDPDWQLPVNQP